MAHHRMAPGNQQTPALFAMLEHQKQNNSPDQQPACVRRVPHLSAAAVRPRRLIQRRRQQVDFLAALDNYVGQGVANL
jgi:hypothetical protein